MRIFSPEDNESRLYWAPVVRFVITAVKEYLSKLVTLIPSWLGSEKSVEEPVVSRCVPISDNIRRRVSHGVLGLVLVDEFATDALRFIVESLVRPLIDLIGRERLTDGVR